MIVRSVQDCSQTCDEWALAVLQNATLFTVIVFRGRDNRERHEFSKPREAFQFSEKLPRSGVYAVTAGHSVFLPNNDADRWCAVWHEAQRELRKQDGRWKKIQ